MVRGKGCVGEIQFAERLEVRKESAEDRESVGLRREEERIVGEV